jgi:membrane-associated protein
VEFFDLVLHLDQHLLALIRDFGGWVYLILFLIIFCETGLVVTPFLPGDSLLFVSGTLAATGTLDVHGVATLLLAAAFSGDNTNYWIGRFAGPKVFNRQQSRLFDPAHLESTHRFYEKHGGKTIIFARFVPVLRTFAPFVAGIGKMDYLRFVAFCFCGGLSWISFFVYGGYYFGNLPLVKENLAVFVVAIVFISILPGIIEYLKSQARRG